MKNRVKTIPPVDHFEKVKAEFIAKHPLFIEVVKKIRQEFDLPEDGFQNQYENNNFEKWKMIEHQKTKQWQEKMEWLRTTVNLSPRWKKFIQYFIIRNVVSYPPKAWVESQLHESGESITLIGLSENATIDDVKNIFSIVKLHQSNSRGYRERNTLTSDLDRDLTILNLLYVKKMSASKIADEMADTGQIFDDSHIHKIINNANSRFGLTFNKLITSK